MKARWGTNSSKQGRFLLCFYAFSAFVSLNSGEVRAEHQSNAFRRRPLARIASWLKGTDLTINLGGAQASCQSTVVAKRELDNGLCRIGLLTAAHCVDSRFRSIQVAGIGEVSRESMKVEIPDIYFQNGGAGSRTPSGGDSATIVFDVACDKASQVQPVPLAPVNSDGTTAIETSKVYLQKRQEETTGNRGQGAQIVADVRERSGAMFEFYAPTPQGFAIVGGDSGGPVFNSKGQLVCPISGSSYEYQRETGQLRRPRSSEDSLLDPFTVVCDKKAISRLKQDLAKWGLAPTSGVDAAPVQDSLAGGSLAERPSDSSAGGSAARAGMGSGNSLQPLLGSAGGGSHLGGGGGSGGGECENGVCPLPGNASSAQRPEADAADELTIPSRNSGGFVEKGPVSRNDLARVMDEAKKAGFKHIVIRYGNDASCPYCRVLRDELRRQFGEDSDVLVIKVNGAGPIEGKGIPQSELHSLDETGDWEKQGGTQVGAQAARGFRAQVNAQKSQAAREGRNAPQRQRADNSQGAGAAQPTPDQAQRPTPRPNQPSTPPSTPPHSSGQNPAAGRAQARPQADESDDAAAAPLPPQNVFNGYRFETSPIHGGLHFLKPDEAASPENAIFLKRQSDGTRRASIKNTDGTFTTLPDDVQKGLYQYYGTQKDKVAHLPEKERRFVSDFTQAPQVQAIAEAPTQGPTPNREIGSKDTTPPAPVEEPKGHEAKKPETPSEPKERPDEEKKAEAPTESEFECIAKDGGFAPKKKGAGFKGLGSSVYPKKELCEAAVAASKNGIVCSFTGLGYKPTHFSGKTQTRPDYGYMGGSSIKNFEDCLKATQSSTEKGVCYWEPNGGWRLADLKGTGRTPAGLRPGPFRSVDQCIEALHEGEEPKKETPKEEPKKKEEPKQEAKKEEPKEEPQKEAEKKEEPSKISSSHALFGNHCASCHAPGQQQVNLPSWATDVDELKKRLASPDEATRNSAQVWAKKLHSVLVDKPSMPPSKTDKEKAEKDPQVRALRDFLQKTVSSGFENPSQRTPASATAPNAAQVLGKEKLAEYRQALSRLNLPDKEIMALLNDPNTLIYDDKSMPPGYQDSSLPVQGFRPSGHGTFVQGAPFLDENKRLRLFTKGAGLPENTQTFHMLALPKDKSGNLVPIEYWTEKDAKDGGTVWKWRFPEGTVSMEAVVQKDSKGQPHVVELRTRKKDGLAREAEANIFTAAPSKASLDRRLAQIAETNPELAKEAAAIRAQLDRTQLRPVEINNGEYRTRFGSRGATENLPSMSEPLVKELLSELESARGASWDSNGKQTAFAPTSNQAFGITPTGSSRGALPVDRVSCNTCHAATNTAIRDAFDYDHSTGQFHQRLNNTTYLYGNFPGNDGNLRWHPFDPSTMPQFGNDRISDNRRLNQALTPILRRVNPPPRR